MSEKATATKPQDDTKRQSETATISEVESLASSADDPELLEEEAEVELGPGITRTRMSRFLTTARADDLTEVTGIECKKEDRTVAHFGTAGALRKHMDKIEDPVPSKFTFDQESLDQVDALGAAYDVVQVRIDDHGRRMRKYDVNSTFQILCLKDTETAPTDTTTAKDLLTEHESIAEEEVRESNKPHRQCGSEWDIQNASLSENLLENSCEEELRLKAKERVDTVPAVERGGPLCFHVMVHKILSMPDDTLRLLTDRITNVNIKEVQGEDVLKIMTIYRHTLKRLGNVKKVPHDMLTKLLEGLQTTSVDEFNAAFHHISASLKTDFNHQAHKLIAIESCLDLAETLASITKSMAIGLDHRKARLLQD
jgi:hypothetical protein